MAMTVEEAKTRRKVEKLLRLSRGTNSTEEAESALLMAQKLMLEAGIEVGTFREAPEQKREVVTVEVPPIKPEAWAQTLASVVAKNFRCYVYWHQQRGMLFSGLAGDVLVCTDVYKAAVAHARSLAKFYVEQCVEQWETSLRCARLGESVTVDSMLARCGLDFFLPLEDGEYSTGCWGDHRWKFHQPITKGEKGVVRRSFLRGFVIGLKEKFAAQVQSQSYALIMVRPQEVVEHVATLAVKTMRTRPVNTLGTARADGVLAGRRFSPTHCAGLLTSRC